MFNPPYGSGQQPPSTPNNQASGRKLVNSAPTPIDQLPPIETLNPDALKELNKLQLQAYLKLHHIIPAVSKPEMKKQMRTLIHALTNKEALPSNANNVPQQTVAVSQVAQTTQPVFNPLTGSFMYPPQSSTIAPVHQQIQQHLHLQQQQQLQAQLQQQQQLQQQLLAQQQAQQAALQAQQQMIAQQQLAAQQQMIAQQQAALQAQQLAAQRQQEAEAAAQQAAAESASKKKTVKKGQSMAELKESGAVSGKSPPHSPRTKEAQSKEAVGGEQCVECRAKKSNKECNNKRCRGCCIKYMIDKKSHICFLHLRDESRRPRIKDPAQTEVIVELIAQAQKEQAAQNGGKERSIDSLANTPSNSNTPLLDSSKTGSPILMDGTLSLEQSDQITLQPPTTTTNTTTSPPLQSQSTITSSTSPPPQQQSVAQPVQQQSVPLAPAQQTAATTAPQEQQQQGKNDSFGRKIQSYYNNHFIGVQAQVAACSNPKRLTPYKDDRYSFFQCYKCDKVISVNGFQLWRHIQSEHTEDFFKFIKENINSRETTNSLLFNSYDSIYNNTKQKTTERFRLTIEWLEEVFSPLPPPEITDKKFFNERIAMLLEFEAKLNSLIDSFDKNIDPVTSKYSVLENLLKDSDTFHKYYDSLSTNQNSDELKNITQEYENIKNVHFEQRPLLITPYHPSAVSPSSLSSSNDGSKVAVFQFIESDSTFSLQSL